MHKGANKIQNGLTRINRANICTNKTSSRLMIFNQNQCCFKTPKCNHNQQPYLFPWNLPDLCNKANKIKKRENKNENRENWQYTLEMLFHCCQIVQMIFKASPLGRDRFARKESAN
jgi:hypothetical protein